eukprot:TRINITY_DN62211_c0_g1_i1.p1 TRINITY_DN62211_c0_g1~~TRINITY_DN62211_c0_g1_i1.p1  ORF type:complete len:360 (-),score=84.44 TRINITY_DN62211_c0_g1_i1:339-1418(-)
MDLYLVTGGTGFVGSWCVKTLLDKGCKVRATVRDPSAEKCNFLRQLPGAERLELVKADLLDAGAWGPAVTGCTFVLHTASPFVVEDVPSGKEEEYFMEPAVKGTENVLKACVAAGVRRVVLTSSIVAIQEGRDPNTSPLMSRPGLDESHWTEVDGLRLPAEMYSNSKTVAERKAWEIVKNTKVELATVNPALVTGPFLSKDSISGSVSVFRMLLKKELPAVPDVSMHMVDVRDVAKMHYLAATEPGAAGKRHMAVMSSESTSFVVLAEALDEAGFDVPTQKLPHWCAKFIALFDQKFALAVPTLGKKRYLNAVNGNAMMGGDWIDFKTSVIDSANTLMELAKMGQMKDAKTSRYFCCCR